MLIGFGGGFVETAAALVKNREGFWFSFVVLKISNGFIGMNLHAPGISISSWSSHSNLRSSCQRQNAFCGDPRLSISRVDDVPRLDATSSVPLIRTSKCESDL